MMMMMGVLHEVYEVCDPKVIPLQGEPIVIFHRLYSDEDDVLRTKPIV